MTVRSCAALLAGVCILAAAAQAQQIVPLSDPEKPNMGWTFGNGPEAPGATGGLSLDPDAKRGDKEALRLEGNFTKGGNYVQAGVALPEDDIREISFWLRYPGNNRLAIRIVDSTDQCHQINFTIQQTDDWQQVIFPLQRFFENRGTADAVTSVLKYECWGGARDGKWHGPGKAFAILTGAEEKLRTLWLCDARAVTVPAGAQAASLKCDFESDDQLPAGWTSQGKVVIDNQNAFQGERSLLLERALEETDKPCSVTTASFAVTPGIWEIALAQKSDLRSPDHSFKSLTLIEYLDGSGRTVESLELVDVFGQKNWQAVSKRIEIPKGVAAARLHIRLDKASGRFWADNLSVSYVEAAPEKPTRISRILFSTAQMGNLLLPQDSRMVNATVEATEALEPNQLEMTYVVRTYWGSELNQPTKVALAQSGGRGEILTYETDIDLSDLPLEIGRYYEVHVQISKENGEPFTNYTSLAILPEAITKQYKPEEIPFTSRNWDNRIPEYLALVDRIGVRVGGLWGGWAANPPYTPNAPLIDQCEKLGLGVLTGTHAEKFGETYSEEALRQGVRNWIEKYGKVRPLYISLGNEPNGTRERLLRHIQGYRIVYEEIKKIDPTITVVATSVPPLEMYFQEGYQNWCDAFDFHVYEDSRNVRICIEGYQQLMEKYNCKKPIWSTELGMSSHGLTRQAVAVEIIRKAAVFFSAGGENMSWFDFLYPDPEAKYADHGAWSQNMFDCRYSRYCPKLDAITYYNVVNGICIKKFVAQKTYEPGISAFLFRDRDGRCLQMLWKDKGRADVLLPLPGVGKATLIHIDGRRSELDAAGKGLTLTIDEDPALLLYDGPADHQLPDRLGEPAAQVTSVPQGIVKGGSNSLAITLNSVSDQNVELIAPPLWNVARAAAVKDADAATRLDFTFTTPENTNAREGDMVVKIKDDKGSYCGELRVLIPVAGSLSMRLLPELGADGSPAVRLIITNNASEPKDVVWRLSLLGQRSMEKGQFGQPVETSAYFAKASDGSATVEGGEELAVTVPLTAVQPLTIYHVQATVTDSVGRTITLVRPIAGFTIVPKAKAAIQLDGRLDEPDWKNCPAQPLDSERQYWPIGEDSPPWKGPKDLSAKLRFLWDDQYLYLAAEVTDDVFANPKEGEAIWAQDGLQLQVDPARESAQKPGKYNYAIALTRTGPTAWCYLSADADSAPAGEVQDFTMALRRADDNTGAMVYEVAIPWSRLAPFKPSVGGNLGLALIVNEDDGAGRRSFIAWYNGPHTKQVDAVADLIFGE